MEGWRKRGLRKWGQLSAGAALVLVLGVGSLSGCTEEQAACRSGERDWGFETLGIELPAAPAVALDQLPKNLVAAHYVGPYRAVALLVKGDVAEVQAHWEDLSKMPDRTEQMRMIVRTLDAMYERGSSTLHMARAWLAADPNSAAAQLTLATALAHAGYEVGKEKSSEEAWAGQYLRGKDLTKQALPLLDKLVDRPDIYGLAARELNLGTRFSGTRSAKDRAAAWDRYMELIAYAPQYEWLYFRAAGNASNPIDESLRTQRFAQLQSLADANALSAVHRITLDQALEAHVNPPGKNPNPQAWRPYWEARAKAAPTIYNYVGWLESEYKVGNWSSMIELADKILALHPHHKRAFELKSHALREMGQSEQAYAAAFSAMMVGSDWAGNQLIQAYARGGLGVMHKDFEAMYAVCKLGANLGLAGAANCMGSAHSEGFAGVERDDKKALAWHLLGARAGNANSAHDVVVLMPRSVASPSHAAEVDALTGFWVRHAAGQGHTAAKNKLLARPEWGKPCPAIEEKAWMEMLLRTLIEVLR